MYAMLSTGQPDDEDEVTDDDATAAFCLLLPGITLYLSPLLYLKKFRNKGNKDGAVRAFYQLEADGLGTVLEVGGSKGTNTVRLCTFMQYVRFCIADRLFLFFILLAIRVSES